MQRFSAALHSKSFYVITGVLLFAALTHAINMFHFPYYENDEGTYMSQAWSLLKLGKLAPYTYWYDHAPGGWIFIALWSLLTGGFFTFGASVNSGRVLMLILHVATTFFMLSISKKLTGRYVPGIIAACIFSLSPLGVYFQRRVLLDNLMIFWVFLSIWLLFRPVLRLRYVLLSAITFSAAVLTKENAIFFLPAFLYWIYSNSHHYNRRFALTSWLTISLSIISLYFLYALLKSEFFPVGFFGDTQPHVSLLETLKEQYDRGNTLPFWDPQSDFAINLAEWLTKDPLTILAGIYSTIVGLILSLKVKTLRLPTFFAILFWIFLLRGKLVIDFYIVPIIPLLAMSIGMLVDYLLRKLTVHKPLLYATLLFLLVSTFAIAQVGRLKTYYTRDETTPQVQSIAWIKENVPSNAKIDIDDSIYLDLHERKNKNDKVFPYADWSWKIEKDPKVQKDDLRNDWRNIQYITLSHEVVKQTKDNNFKFLKLALDNSFQVADFTTPTTSYRDLSHYISTNGDWMSIYKVMNKNDILLNLAWKYYTTHYLHSYGQIIDPQSGETTSTNQASAMLTAVWMNDKKTYAGLWQWTKDHLQWRTDDKLLSSDWVKKNGKYQLGNSNSSANADEDIALSLLFASKQWHNPTYLSEAKLLINDIWKKEVLTANGQYYLAAGTAATLTGSYYSNPSYLSPASYRIFAQVDTHHPWNELANDSYALLYQVSSTSLTAGILINPVTGSLQLASSPRVFQPDTFPKGGRVALDAAWFHTPEALAYLTSIQPVVTNDQTLLVSQAVINQQQATKTFNQFEKQFSDDGYWNNSKDLNEQQTSWLASAIYAKRLADIWTAENPPKLTRAN